ncbi:DUF3667 domain-containing protein [Maribacter sp. HTCC2170]|uniref:DUF3667 domain-containing protein n=1 Tax=Maribacter sp. (strain HTCC2170 / KCCM 42371) TaxID=313603 RepID=UPI00006B1B1C|nr:DUF3667 domain-containing protein [Maribacter sp. HTCC2170]EAR00749.1 hypothetical protein FB2170_16731 [Maribacter sp. HTCC2170]
MHNKLVSYTKGRYQLKHRGTECKNCGHPLDISDKYCPNCSQANSTKKLTLKDFFDEFFSTLISYDSKLLKTLVALLWFPGKITKDYINGKRVSYTNPFRFLLSLAIIYFLMISYDNDFAEWDKFGSTTQTSDYLDENGTLSFNFGDEEQQNQLQDVMDSLKLNTEIKKATDLKKSRDSTLLSNPEFHFKKNKNSTFKKRIPEKFEVLTLLIKERNLRRFSELKEKYGIPETRENRIIFNTSGSVSKFSRQPGSFTNDLISKLPFTTFFFLPVFAIFIWLAYIRKKYNYTDHLIFSFHNQSLLFILLIISFLVNSIFNVNSGWIFITIFSTYLFLSMKKFYNQGTFKTIIKYLFLNTIFFILAGISVILLFAGSLITY